MTRSVELGLYRISSPLPNELREHSDAPVLLTLHRRPKHLQSSPVVLSPNRRPKHLSHRPGSAPVQVEP